MQKFNLKELIEYNDSKFNPKVLVNEAGYRMVLLNLRKGQSVPEHANQTVVTVYTLVGHITFYAGTDSCELRAGEVVRLDAGVPHRLEAHEDSALYVLAAGQSNAAVVVSEELDLREVPRPLRHPLVFEKLDAHRMHNLLDKVCLRDHGQIFITDTHGDRIRLELDKLNIPSQIISL